MSQGAATGAKATYIPPYKPSTGSIGIFSPANRVKSLQGFFKIGGHHDLPVHLRGPRDGLIYRGIMGFSVLGIAIAYFSIYQMATGTMKKKGGDN